MNPNDTLRTHRADPRCIVPAPRGKGERKESEKEEGGNANVAGLSVGIAKLQGRSSVVRRWERKYSGAKTLARDGVGLQTERWGAGRRRGRGRE